MEKKVRDLVYLDSKRYISLDSLRTFYWGIIIIPFMMVVMGIAGESAFPIISIAIWSLLYWTFVLVIQSKRTKKTFELRFLVNGIAGLFISFLFWIFVASFNIASDTPFLKFNFFLWILLFYLIFTVIYVALVILGVHKGVFEKMRAFSRTKTAIAISAFFGALIPGAGVSGMYASRLIRAHASVSIQHAIITVLTVLLIFIPALAHINFVQYYFCKKYRITCDEDGCSTSAKLMPLNKKKQKKKRSVISKILITMAIIAVSVLGLLVLIGIIINL